MNKEELIELAIKAMRLSYSPYSNFKVGSVLLTADGKIFEGANIENAAYGCSMCAERNAIYNAYMHGIKIEDIKAIAIVGNTKKPIAPCGQCRQVFSELLLGDCKVYLGNLNREIKEITVNELLPYRFDEEDL